MKTAIIYSGQARTFRHLWQNHIFRVLRKLPEPTIFVSVADDAQADDMLLLRDAKPDWPFFMEKHVQPDHIPAPPEILPWTNGYPPSTTYQNVLKQLWALNRAWEFVGDRANEFDLFVRMRCDLNFLRFEMPPSVGDPVWYGIGAIGDEGRIVPSDFNPRDHLCFTPWWSRWGGVQDRIALLGRKAAEAYFTTFAVREELWKMHCPCHPETMVATALELAGITPSHTLATEFVARRVNELVPHDPQPWELAEYARTRP